MIALTHETRVFLKTGITDLRLSFEGLRGIVVNTIRQEPTSGFVFVFCNRAKNRVKCLFWDGSGMWVCAKRIEGGTLGWPKDESGAQQINGMQLRLLLEGFELKSRRGWYRRGAAPKGLEEVRPS
jgi:transposase